MIGNRFRLAVAVLALVGAAGSLASEESVLDGRIVGADGAWLGVVGEDPGAVDWVRVEDGTFQIGVPQGQGVDLVAIAKDRVPLAVAVPPDDLRKPLDLQLEYGLALDGLVRSGDGRPLSGAEIRVLRDDGLVREGLERTGVSGPLRDRRIEVATVARGNIEMPSNVRATWTSGSDGKFRILGLEAGIYVVEALVPEFTPLRLAVVVQEHAANNVELELFPSFFVAGNVVDRTGAPLAGADVAASWWQPASQGELGRAVSAAGRHEQTRTSEDGSFRLGPFERGPAITILATSVDGGSSKRQEVVAPVDALVIMLRRDVVRGRVVDAISGKPVEFFELRRLREGNLNGEILPIRSATGQFAAVIAPDSDALSIEAPGRFPWYTPLYTGRSGDYDLGEIELNGTRSITGRVSDGGSGEPIAGAFVRRSAKQHRDNHLSIYMSNYVTYMSNFTDTDANGTFALGGLSLDSDYLEVSIADSMYRGLFEVPPGLAHLEIELAFDGVVAGSLKLPDGSPATGAVELRHRMDFEARRMEVGADGAFRWENLGPGRYMVEAKPDSGAATHQWVGLSSGEAVEDLEFVVEPGGRVSGTVTGVLRGEWVTVTTRGHDARYLRGDGTYEMESVRNGATIVARTFYERNIRQAASMDDLGEARVDFDFTGDARLSGTVTTNGRPAVGIYLWVQPQDRSRQVAIVTTDDFGRYAANGLSDGPHSVKTYAGQVFDVHVAGHATLDIDLPANSLSGVALTDRTGRPAAGVQVRLDRIGTPYTLGTWIASDGSFQFVGLDEGEYLVRTDHADFEEQSQHLNVAGQETVELRLTPKDGNGDDG